MNRPNLLLTGITSFLCSFVVAVVVSHPPTASAQNIDIEVLEPIDHQLIQYQLIAPPQIGAPQQARISIKMRIENNLPIPVTLERIEMMGQVVSNFHDPVVIKSGDGFAFQNYNGGREGDSIPLIVNASSPPSTIPITAYLQGETSPIPPISNIVAARPHINDGGPLLFPGKATDLRQNEAWGSSSNHPADHQVFALDVGVWGWNADHWSERFPGTDDTRKEHFRIYGMPVFAMADGTVCWALNDHEERPTLAEAETISPSLGQFNAGGNQVFIKTGTEVTVYAHLQPGSIPSRLLTPGAAVKQGQYLGKVGLSGATSHPHVHIHVKKEPAAGAPDFMSNMNACDSGFFRPMAFRNLQSLTLAEAHTLAIEEDLNAEDWTALTNHSAPHEAGLLYPTLEPYPFDPEATDSKQYIGVWREGRRIELKVKAAGWEAFTNKWSELSNDGFRLIEINSFEENGARQFLGVFQQGGGGHFLINLSSWDAFTERWDELSKRGFRLVDLDTYLEDGNRFFVGVFRRGTYAHALVSLTGWDHFTQRWDEAAAQGLRLVDLETFSVGDHQRQYVGVFRAGTDGYALQSLTGWDAFKDQWNILSRQGLRLIDVETFALGDGQRQFLGVYRQGTGGYVLQSLTGYDKFLMASEHNNSVGLRLVDIHVEQ